MQVFWKQTFIINKHYYLTFNLTQYESNYGCAKHRRETLHSKVNVTFYSIRVKFRGIRKYYRKKHDTMFKKQFIFSIIQKTPTYLLFKKEKSAIPDNGFLNKNVFSI